MKLRCLPFLCLSVALTGCGGSGGGEGGATLPPAPVSTTFGPVSLEGFVTGEPVYGNGSGASVVGLSGNFSAVTVTNPKPSLDQTQIAFAENRRLYVVDYDGKNRRAVTGERIPSISRASYSAGGGALYFSDGQGLWSMSSSGSTPVLIENGGVEASVSPDGTRIMYRNAQGIWTSSITGTGDTLIPGSLNWAAPRWWDNTRAQVRIGTQNEIRNISDGTSNTILDTESPLGGGRTGRYWFSSFYNGAYQLNRFTVDPNSASFVSRTFPMPADLISSIVLSPDAQEMVTFEYSAIDEGSFAIRRRSPISPSTVLGTVITGVSDFTTLSALAWQPLVTNRVLAGAGSFFGGDAHAVVFGRSGTKPGGIAMARALTPSTVKVATEDKNTTGPNVTYTLEADRFTKLSFSLDKNYSLFNTPVTATTNGAFVTFTSNSGDVVDIITYAVTRNTAKPKLRKEGSLRVYEGAIQGVFDARGKNLIPQGASLVKLDINGRLVTSK